MKGHFSHLLFFLLFQTGTNAVLIEDTWTITEKFVAPDGVTKLLQVVNRQFPGPEIRGRVGDRVRIKVINSLISDTTTIHWHGIKQIGTPWSDGTQTFIFTTLHSRSQHLTVHFITVGPFHPISHSFHREP